MAQLRTYHRAPRVAWPTPVDTCSNCASKMVPVNGRCSGCGSLLRPRPEYPERSARARKRHRQKANRKAKREAKGRVRHGYLRAQRGDGRREANAALPDADEVTTAPFMRSDPGTPLGVGMPSGGPLRLDGETHREAWMRIVRADPCAYCGGEGGTLDHIIPKARATPGVAHVWLNFTAACGPCNSTKSNRKMLPWLAARAVSKTRYADPDPTKEEG